MKQTLFMVVVTALALSACYHEHYYSGYGGYRHLHHHHH
jgi:hypothetical protein